MVQRLDTDLFKQVVAYSPLVSIDLIVRNQQGQVLLGLRLNRPAIGYWFVPGGRICKDETMASAFTRLVKEELGIERELTQATCLGPYEHFYTDNFSGTDFTTHYVVLGYRLEAEIALTDLPKEQHSHYRWFDVDELLQADDVHDNTKLYFQ
ncbi:GDP-mannose mannosyl hydrolase [Vibrio mediterranei]|uniref:GDP-mannose mannosyl hydrolase n=1 Tax=Vibrio mediterranei TaxID=689 RepID=UPI00148DB8D1|nr:GDP-mannose mannosyl hydrolase [Vibrio mediterranei]NOH29036.1 GDP-mannose mannosyl hydrolase [Vibrio mediterranei]